MRRQYRSFVVTMVVVSLCCGFIGCKSNGGRWYKPSSYTWHNPFKNKGFEEDEFGQLAEDNNGIRMPREGQSPDLDLTTPAGGYSGNQVAQTPSRSTNVNVPQASGSTVGGYPQQQTPSVALSNPPYQNQPVNYSNVPQGQPAMQSQYPQNQYPQSQYPQSQYPQPQNGMTQAPNPQPQYNTTYPQPVAQQTQYDPSYGQVNQVSNGYATGQNTYSSNEEYYPGGSRF
ncbi:MAG: hypothetical protein FWC43_07705 [Planctomycetaceae bacterium]|nr:hypothetical protein [Planctomycetaceae bacterium]